MAQLKDTTIQGSARVTDTLYSNAVQAKIFNIPTASNGTTYGPGSDGQVLKSNGASVYWASDSNSDINVKQLAAITTSGAYPIILANSTATTEVTGTVNKSANLTYNPSTKALSTGGTINGLTFTAASTGFTIAGGTTSKTLTVSNTYTLGAACAKGVTDNSSNADVTSSDTNLITGRTLYYQLAKKGYTTNTGTVTSITLTSGSGITVSDSGTAITGSGSRTISITGMNTSSGSTSKCLTEKGTWASFSNNSGTVTSVTLTSGAGITVSDSGTAITGSGSRTISITGMDTSSGSTTQCLTKKGTWASFTNNAGTVTSVQVAASDPLQSSTGTASSTTLSTTISFKNQSPNKVLAGPSSGSATAAPTFRSLVAADIPNLSWNKITSDKPTTLSGYGITDAATSGHTHSQYVLKSGDTMTGVLVANNFVSKYGVEFQNSSGTNVGGIFQDMEGANQFYMDEYTTGGVRECYLLPAPSATSTSFYDILTTKNAVTAAQGGTGITSYAVGDILYCGAANTLTKLTGNTSTTQKFLAMTGTGSAGAAPSWVAAPSGEVFTVTLSVSHQVYTANKTFAEIQTAFNSGKTVVANVPDTGGSHYALCYLSSLSSSSASFVGFDTYTYTTTSIRRVSCAISSSNSVSVSRTHLTSGHEAQPITIDIYEGNPYTAACTDYANIDDIYNVAYYASSGDKGYIRALIIANGTSGTPDGAPEPPIDNQWYNLTNVEKYWDYDANEELWILYYTFTFSGIFNVNGTSYLRTIKVTEASNAWDNLSGATVTYSESALGGSYLPLSGGTMTGGITLANTDTPILSLGNDAGWTMNKYGNITHKRSNANDYIGIIGYNVSGDIRFYYDSGNITSNGYIAASNGIYATNGSLVSRAATAFLKFENASSQPIGEIWSQSGRITIRNRPSAGSSYYTDIVLPTAKTNGTENVYVYTSRNFSLSGTTLTITVPS